MPKRQIALGPLDKRPQTIAFWRQVVPLGVAKAQAIWEYKRSIYRAVEIGMSYETVGVAFGIPQEEACKIHDKIAREIKRRTRDKWAFMPPAHYWSHWFFAAHEVSNFFASSKTIPWPERSQALADTWSGPGHCTREAFNVQ